MTRGEMWLKEDQNVLDVLWQIELLELHVECWFYFKSNVFLISHVPHRGNNPRRKKSHKIY